MFEIGDALGAPAPGAYVLTAALPGDDAGQAAAQWFTVSDLGLASVTGADGLTLFVRGLTDAAPRAGAQATLLARNNTVLGDATTDATGRAVFDAGLMRGSGGDAPGMVQVTEGADFAFLDLTRPGFDLSDRGVEGRAAPPPIDIFMTTERGVYRPGETVFATLLARDAQVAAVGGLPLTLVARRADGVEFARWVLPDAGAGGRAHLFALPSRAMRGRWRLQVYADPDGPQLAEQDFLVEDFVPEKIDFAIDLPPEPLPQVPAPLAEVTARYLFGAPGAGLTIEGEVVVRPERGLDAFPGYEFGMVDDDAIPRRATLREVDTDAEGRASLPLVFPELGGGTAFFSADTVLRAREGSGRPVERVATHLLAPAAPRIGIRALFDGAAAEASSPEFDVVAVGPDLAAIPLGAVRWRLEKINRWWQWYEVNGRWNYEPVTRRERVANGTAEIGDTPLRLTTPVDWGRYELKVISEARPEIRASLSFSAGWFVADAGADTPDVLEVGLDRATYAPGDTARLRVVARDAGTVAVQVLTDRVVDFRTVAVSAGETEIALPVTEDWGPGAYVNATLIRPLGEANEGPARAIGLAWVGVAPGPRLLEAAIAMPDAVDPRGPVEVVLEASGTTAGETLYATIAAVDLGILNVTGFESPDPAAHYFAQRRLGVTLRDLYGRLIDTRGGALGRVRSGGDGASANRPAPPPTEEPVAFFSGPLTIDADGSARVQFDLPDFNGTLRVMAVVWSDTGVGHAEKDVLVRDPVVVSAALPRFLAPGDDSRLRLDLTHVSGPPGDVTLAISADGPVSLGTVPAVITLGAQGRATIEVPIRGGVPGDATLKVVPRRVDGNCRRP